MQTQPALGTAELDSQTVSLLPARETMCTIGCVNVATVVGVNLAIAVNAATINSIATAYAWQQLSAWQR
ncbi:MAG TPA: hypothetical protein VIP98_07065 [Microlunatus sp.]